MVKIRSSEVTPERILEFARTSEIENLTPRLRDRRHVTWKFAEAPLGSATAIDLVNCDRVVGRLWLTKRAWSVLGQTIIMGFPNDLLIEREARSLHSVAQLLRETFRLAEQNCNLFYHGSNPSSEPLYRTLFRRSPLLSLRVCILPLKPFGLVSKRLHRREKHTFRVDSRQSVISRLLQVFSHSLSSVSFRDKVNDADIDKLATNFSSSHTASADRSAEWHKWRFSINSGIEYHTRFIFRHGELVGYITWSDTTEFGIDLRVVVDIVLPEPPSILMRLKLLALVTRDCSAELLLFMGNAGNRALQRWMRLPFVAVPTRLLPQSVNFYFCLGNTSLNPDEAIQSLRSSYLTLFDLDFF